MDGREEGDEARQWCVDHLSPGEAVIVVVGVNMMGEFVLGVPPFDALGGENELVDRSNGATAFLCQSAGWPVRRRWSPTARAVP
jgi:hypothetical protein